jgi:hypothetical protein
MQITPNLSVLHAERQPSGVISTWSARDSAGAIARRGGRRSLTAGNWKIVHVTCVGVCSLLECATGFDLRVELVDTLAERLVAEERFLAGSNEIAALERQAARWIAQELLGPFTSNSPR